MKSEKGITLISLTIYVIVMLIVVGIASMFSSFFFKDVKLISNIVSPVTEYTNFNSYFSEEVNHENIKVLECKENYIVFNNYVQYTFVPENKAIYRDNVKICEDVEMCKFEYKIKNGKNVVAVDIQIGTEGVRTVEYTLKN